MDPLENMEFSETALWKQMWAQNLAHIAVFSIFLIALIMIMLFRDRLAKSRPALNIVRYAALLVSFVYIGLILKAQPTTTNIVIILNGLKEGQFPLGLYMMEPYIFLSFIFIGLTIFLWGRGVFCGWLCPYGAMLELLNKLYEKIIPKKLSRKFSQKFRLNLPEKIHWKAIYLKYVILGIIIGIGFYNFMLSEYLTEVEPFRTFVLKLKREWYFVAYFAILTTGSVIVYRAFCRYLCPLGAALAVPSLLKKIPFIRLKRYDFCSTCRICPRACSPQAIGADGVISGGECLSCLDCQINFWDEDICPALIKKKRQEAKGNVEGRGASLALSLLPFAFFVLSVSSQADAKTLAVGSDYKTIGDALKKAKDGDVVEVHAGEYKEAIKIQKAVHLKGINNPVISISEGNMIEVSAKGAVIEGMTLKNNEPVQGRKVNGIVIVKGSDKVVVRNNRLIGAASGVWIVSSKGVKVENNNIEGEKHIKDLNFRGTCIVLTDAQEAEISGNRLAYCRDGIYMDVSHDLKIIGNDISKSRYAMHTMWADRSIFNKNKAYDNYVGIAIMYSKHSQMNENLTAGNQTCGLLLIQAVRSRIEKNIIVGNTKGLFFYSSFYNTVLSNLIMNNNLGIHNWGASEENIVNGNSFVNNEVQVKYIASSKGQEWNSNYWSDYIGWDMTGDRVGDAPYESSSVIDHIFWRYPAAKVLFASPAMQMLWMLERQFPIITVPKVVDKKPAMTPLHPDWREIRKKYPYTAERYYGDVDKFQIVH
jgi:nitrous oxidase accessory protein